MAFRYTLQSVLRLRQGLERQEEQRLLACAIAVARIRAEIEQLDKYHEGRLLWLSHAIRRRL